MTKILICDDEGIVRESLEYMLVQHLGKQVEVFSARNGRSAIELFEEERPDIVIMDIQMPGINGIEAMKAIRSESKNVIFIVLTAYDKFEYSKVSIDLGVYCYLTKPINREKFCDIVSKAIEKTKARKEKAQLDLRVKEKLDAVVPMIEQGYIYNTVFEHKTEADQEAGYQELLGVEVNYGYVILFSCGENYHKGKLSNPIGAGIKLQKNIRYFRELVKETLPSFVGEVMSNSLIVLVPTKDEANLYDERVKKIEQIRALVRELEKKVDVSFKVGIGKVHTIAEISKSYKEAKQAMRADENKVAHAADMVFDCLYEETYPIELENRLFHAVAEGKTKECEKYAREFMEWLEQYSPVVNNTIRLKVMEFVLWAEHLAYCDSGRVYRIDDRALYLDIIMSLSNYLELGVWFQGKMQSATMLIQDRGKQKAESIVEEAKQYIENNFSDDLSLEYLAKELGISPYYFSRLFKEEEGVNYIDFLTKIRMDYAKEALQKEEKSIKEICVEAGYSDPNYFSRIFKKWTGKTPTQFREKGIFI